MGSHLGTAKKVALPGCSVDRGGSLRASVGKERTGDDACRPGRKGMALGPVNRAACLVERRDGRLGHDIPMK